MDEFGVNRYDWENGMYFDWEDWRSNFDMNEDRWYENYDFSVIFPQTWEIDGQTYICDEFDSCWTFDDEQQLACEYQGDCYTPEEALQVYFEGAKENWNHMQDFNWEDWRSNFEITQGRWFDNYDFSYLFPVELEHQGSLY
jgi:hypothetical protein